ncbi:hypothetical protein ACIBHX_31055 [Nonomuraea sp. NPDC050536]|uniref:hypothetical protein n=1 Tax=Nonomuraea sp. NPDC050536 TaxID=3364366 RepID=UPI0037C706CF
MNDPYRIETRRHAPPRKPWALRALLWAVLVVAVAINVVANTIGDGGLYLGLGSGLVAVACLVGLVVHHVRSGRR